MQLVRLFARAAIIAVIGSLAFVAAVPAEEEAPLHFSLDAVRTSSATVSPQSPIEVSVKTKPRPKRLAHVPKPKRKQAPKPKSPAGEKRVSAARATDRSNAALRNALAEQIERHPILAGTSITYGDAQGYQAISYYTEGKIVVSQDHQASVSRIVEHEVWHVIDWRDNNRIDWGENVPTSSD